jgi:hypothetical protein
MHGVHNIKNRIYLISGFRRDVDVICGLLGNYTASCGNYLPTHCPETSVNNYHMTLCNYPKDHRLEFICIPQILH